MAIRIHISLALFGMVILGNGLTPPTHLERNYPCQIITLSDSYTDQMIILRNPDGSEWHRFSYLYDDSDRKYDYDKSDFRPLSFHPDYYDLALEVHKTLGNGQYEVWVNDRELKIVSLDNFLTVMNCADYFVGQTISITPTMIEENQLQINYPTISWGEITTISGDSLSFHSSGKSYKIKWIKDDRITISLLLE